MAGVVSAVGIDPTLQRPVILLNYRGNLMSMSTPDGLFQLTNGGQ